MTHQEQEASAVVAVPLTKVEDRLKDVESWGGFLAGVSQVVKTSHERYVFGIGEGKHLRQAKVVVRFDHQAHCFRWKALEGPLFEGTLALAEVDSGHTRVTLSLTELPGGGADGWSDLFSRHGSRVVLDLQRLEDQLARVPEPTRE
jgi:hypothetical protein